MSHLVSEAVSEMKPTADDVPVFLAKVTGKSSEEMHQT